MLIRINTEAIEMRVDMEKKSIKKNATLNIIKTVFSLVFPLITYPYALRVLQIEKIGKFEFSASIVSYFSLVAALGISAYAVREGSKYRNDRKKCSEFASEIFSINFYSTILAYILLILCLIFVGKFRPYIPVILILSSEILLATLGVNWIYTIFEDFSYITKITLILQVIAVILLFVFVHNSNDLYVYSVITVISSSGASIFMFLRSHKYVDLHLVARPDTKHLKPILIVFSITIATTIYISSDTTILGWIAGDYSVGLYSTSVKIYKIVKQVLSAAVAVVIPRFAFYIGTKDDKGLEKLGNDLMNYMILGCVPCMVGLFFLAKPIVEVFAGTSYSEAHISLSLLSIALIFAVFANIFCNGVLISFKKEKIVMIATIISAVGNIVLNFILIPYFKENAAAFTTVLAEACICFISFAYARRCFKIRCNIKNVYLTVLGSVVIGIICGIVKRYYMNNILQLVLCVTISVLFYAAVQIVFKNPIVFEILRSLQEKSRKDF